MILKESLKNNFNIALPKEAYHHLSGDVELVKIPLRNIRVPYKHRKTCPIYKTDFYKSLRRRNKNIQYRKNSLYNEAGIYMHQTTDNSLERMERLQKSLLNEGGYNPSKCVIALRKDNTVIDGAHRCAILYQKYGGNYQILVVREK